MLELSSIFSWYEGDFTDWLKAQHPEREATLRSYVLLHAPSEKAEAIRGCPECRTAFVPYDWGLNDQRRTSG